MKILALGVERRGGWKQNKMYGLKIGIVSEVSEFKEFGFKSFSSCHEY